MKDRTDYDGLRLAAWLVILFWAVVITCCTGCGGGSDEEQGPDQFIGPPDCKARPELCV